jgi:hypothetical protein
MMMHEDWGTTQNYVVEDACGQDQRQGNARWLQQVPL